MHEDLKPTENPNELLERLLSGVTINGSDEIYEIDKEEFRRNLPALIEPADSSQHSAVVDMLQGDSFVLRGPPGTANLKLIIVSAGLYAGKSVLFIADKEAALEVVN